jgi:hypothetical protein
MKTLQRIEKLMSTRNLIGLASIAVFVTVVAFSFSILGSAKALEKATERPAAIVALQPTFTPTSAAQRLAVPATERFEVGADTGTLQALAYTSNANGDAYVEIKGDTIYAVASLGRCEPCALSSPRNSPENEQLRGVETATETPTAAKFKAQDNVNLRAAPWGDVLGATMNGSEFIVTGRAGDWLRVQWDGREAWIYGDMGQQAGDYSSVPTVSIPVMQAAAAPPTPAPTVAPVVEAPPQQYSASTIPVQLQPEANYPTFYVAVSQNNEPADGRWCVIFHDGDEVGRDRSVPVFDLTNKGTPWTDDDKRYNCSVKFGQFNPQNWIGTWVIELWDGAGTVIGRSDSFTLAQDMQQVWIEFFLH